MCGNWPESLGQGLLIIEARDAAAFSLFFDCQGAQRPSPENSVRELALERTSAKPSGRGRPGCAHRYATARAAAAPSSSSTRSPVDQCRAAVIPEFAFEEQVGHGEIERQAKNGRQEGAAFQVDETEVPERCPTARRGASCASTAKGCGRLSTETGCFSRRGRRRHGGHLAGHSGACGRGILTRQQPTRRLHTSTASHAVAGGRWR